MRREIDAHGIGGGMGEDNDDEVDIKDIEFRLRNDDKKVRSLLESSKAYSYKDLTILKFILCSGLYPQFATADEFNHAKGGPEQLFHTRVKPFNVLHPNCIFASNPEYLTLEDMDKVNVPGFLNQTKYPFSTKHQVLVYMSLLETNKPYVVNAVRMPALQSFLLFSRKIESNMDFSKLVVDSWIEIQFADPQDAQIQVIKAAFLRNIWQELATLRLEETLQEDDDSELDEAKLSKQIELEMMLSKGLVDFVHSESLFCLRRLLPGDLKVIYSRTPIKRVEVNPFSSEFKAKPDDEKGGIQLNDYILYDCLENEASVLNRLNQAASCPICNEEVDGNLTLLQRLSHMYECLQKREDDHANQLKEDKKLEKQKSNPNAEQYECEDCKSTFYFTPIQLLRHKMSHKKS